MIKNKDPSKTIGPIKLNNKPIKIDISENSDFPKVTRDDRSLTDNLNYFNSQAFDQKSF